MNNLAEIEAAVESLPPTERHALLHWLRTVVDDAGTVREDEAKVRIDWVSELARRRQRGFTGRPGTPLQKVLDEIRGER